mmetsp:Transcript_50699/g.84303  ORF Transcript_50699/g.84303 Transcript_50699/m.84303 type:complete len:163 (+) Transcript_50699:49-537(+)
MATISLHVDHPQKVTVHSLPCKIKYSGKAAISDYFIERDSDAALPNETGITGSIVGNELKQAKYKYDETSAYFRGRALLKNSVEFKDGVCGYRLKQTQTANNSEKVWQTNGSFKEVQCWRLNNKKRTKYEHALNDWFKISEAIHGTSDSGENQSREEQKQEE